MKSNFAFDLHHCQTPMRKPFCLFLLSLLPISIWAQPSDNPYRTHYPNTPASHWTEVLKWANIFNVENYGANGSDQLSDQTAVEQAIQAAASAGGGVVFFPAGTYFFQDDLKLLSGVILRGENPSVLQATDPEFRPSSKLVFPAYVFDTLANGGRGNPNNTAFKLIGGIGSFRNVGLVNLDINRARIEMHPNFDSLGTVVHAGAPGGSANYQPREKNRNCIIMGIRSNNAALPDPAIPDTSGPAKMRKWQRAPYRFSANIDLYFDANVVIANNRLNDNPTDNFDQPGFRVRNRCTACDNYKFIGQPGNSAWNAENFIPVIAGHHARFRYEDHYGISLNRHKKVIVNGRQTIQTFIWYPEPQQEPSLYAKSFSILDNWVYKTNRVGLWVAGQGMEIRRNIIRDSVIPGSSATPKNVWLTPNFAEINRNFSATYENRGIDFGGAEIVIDSNDIQMRTFRFPESQYSSIDGEGIMDQGNGGGTRPNGIYITNNTLDGDRNDCTNPTIGLYNTQEAHNILYRGNKFTGNSGCLQVQMRDFSMTNVLMENNSGIKNLQFYGQGGGYNCIARNNIGAPGQKRLSCYVIDENNQDLANHPSGCYPNLPGAVDTSAFPAVKLESPVRDTLFTLAPASFQLEARVVRGTADSVVFFRDGYVRLGKGIAAAGGLWIFNWAPPTFDGKYYLSASSYFTPSGGSKIRHKAKPILFEVNDGDPFQNNPDDILLNNAPTVNASASKIWMYPNPAKDYVVVQIPENEQLLSVELMETTGRKVPKTIKIESGRLDTRNLSAGIYFVVAITNRATYTAKLLKKN